MTSCVVKWCKRPKNASKKITGITFHKFPQNEYQRAKWIEAVRLERREDYWLPTPASRVCSIHFDAEDMYTSQTGNNMLKKTAVPICTMVFKSKFEEFSQDEHSSLILDNSKKICKPVKVPEEVAVPASCFVREDKEGTLKDLDSLASSSEVDNVPVQDHLLSISAPAQGPLCTLKVEIDEDNSSNLDIECNDGSITTTENLPTLNISIPAQKSLCTIKEEKEEENTSTHQIECNAGPSLTQNLSRLVHIPEEDPVPDSIPINTIKEEDITFDTELLDSISEVDNVPAQERPYTIKTEEDITSTQETESNAAGFIHTQNLPTLINIPNQFPQPIAIEDVKAPITIKQLFNSPSSVGTFSTTYVPHWIKLPNSVTQQPLCVIKRQKCLPQATGSPEEASTSTKAGNVLTHLPKLSRQVVQQSMEIDVSSSQRQPSFSITSAKNTKKPTPQGVTPDKTDKETSDRYEIILLQNQLREFKMKLARKNKRITYLENKWRNYNRKHQALEKIFRDLAHDKLLSTVHLKALRRKGFLKNN